MTVQQLLAQHFKLMYDTAAANLAGSREQSVTQPHAGGNCANLRAALRD
jgi:hypothetical protein